jgi:zinc D-Ala-D-Ala carboxypeptidase
MSVYFTEAELRCRCGRAECDAPKPSQALLSMLDLVRRAVGQPLIANSGCRCAYWNAKQGGVAGSEHETGEGADIACTDSRLRFRILFAAWQTGVVRIGIGKTFVHLGVSKTHDQQVVWHYYPKES